MNTEPEVQPLPYKRRQGTFRFLALLFLLSLPFLYLYATGYRLDLGGETNFISTGGIYVAAERTGAEIYIDDELVRETRVFRRAFYAQSLEPGTHRVHVQKEGHHTWVKELPVSPHLVTEAQAFNLPHIPQVRVVAAWESATGSQIVATSSLIASSTTSVLATTTTATSTFAQNEEYLSLVSLFATTSTSSDGTLLSRAAEGLTSLLDATTTATTTAPVPTTTKEWRGVRLFEHGGDVHAKWIGSHEDMPYYYCAESFEPYSTSSEPVASGENIDLDTLAANTAELLHPVQEVSEGAVCDPSIVIDRLGQEVTSFDFFPGSTDLVIVTLQDGVYVVEVDDRAWQNIQPLIEGEGLDMRVFNNQIYIYDGTLIYEIILG